MATVDELKQRRAVLQAESEELPNQLVQLEKARDGIVGFEHRPDVKEKYECERARIRLAMECGRLELRALSAEIHVAELETELGRRAALASEKDSAPNDIVRRLASATTRNELARARLAAIGWLVKSQVAEISSAATWMCRVAADDLPDKEEEYARRLLERVLLATSSSGGRGTLEEVRRELLVFLEQTGT